MKLIFYTLLFCCSIFIQCKSNETKPNINTAQTNKTEKVSKSEFVSNKNIPDYVYEVLEYIDKNKKAPEGYVGGRAFQNREKQLPINNASGYKIQYKEWDVHPKIEGKNRGAERLVTDDETHAYYTKNHYKTFEKIR